MKYLTIDTLSEVVDNVLMNFLNYVIFNVTIINLES